MNKNLFLFFNGWGILGLIIFTLAYSGSHFFWMKKLNNLDFFLKIVGFVALIFIFILSGWKAGLVALPIGFVGSCIGAILVKSFFRNL